MLKILAFLLVVLAAGIGFGWLADNPGSVTFVWQGQQVETSLMVFLILLTALLVATVVLVWLVRAFFKTPHAVGNWWSTRRRDRGYGALSTGIIAAGAGDQILARRMTTRAQKLLGTRKEPLVRFLDAQTAMIEGDHSRARSAFEQMEGDPETRLLALRGLYLEAERLGDDAAARNYAERAVRIAPHVPWAGGAVLDSKSLAGDWDGALDILEAQKNTRLIDRAESKRLRAVLLTAKATTLLDRDPAGAKAAGSEAHGLAPDLVPAALVAAQALFRLGDLRRGSKILETSWVNGPHPEIAEAYVHARPGDSVEDRLKRAQKLHSLKPGHVEAELALAHAALDARDLLLARKCAMAAIEAEPRESAFLLMADIEEEETGEIGRVRQWLARAIRAPRDPAWTADGIVSKTWAPLSPVTGRLDAFQWKVPMERVGGEGALLDERPGLSLGETRGHGADGSLPLHDVTPGEAVSGGDRTVTTPAPAAVTGKASDEVAGGTVAPAAFGRPDETSGRAA
ncbi:heme biosynthesis HemY N-terminal domain-containing protein [Aurantimonas sp. Leaf443]|uniref:heme biosynthesis protein HemY n=1 Tax=Aurantimonas sp. Leaf443 TaxID=1736378 RepID=UPI0009EA2BDA|nr:heme biosynthesis HemY N-terminal domain-containing protein [Aurantimonas sp. Leaf443]